jgi:octaprenyl-diphosphate synthase
MLLPFHDVVKDDFDAVNSLILNQLHSDVELVENIGHYLIEAGGKRLRPLLVLLAARACNYQGSDHIALATIIEFIHTATLLHDDVVDTSDLRRGRATANARWGNAPSVLVGDFLYSRAFQMMVTINRMEILDILANTTNIISEGEVQQLINAGNPGVSEQDYFTVIDKKTAQLFQAAARVGAVIANADGPVVNGLASYGHHIGMAFQLTDDALDYSGSTEDLGKNVGDDLAEGKPTLPLIHVMHHGTASQAKVVRQAIENADGIAHLEEVKQAIDATGAIDYTMAIARQHASKAIDAIGVLPASAEKNAMSALAEFSFDRNH